jgi:hypothetical protein
MGWVGPQFFIGQDRPIKKITTTTKMASAFFKAPEKLSKISRAV